MIDKDINLYDVFINYKYKDIMECFKKAKTKEEKDFYAKLSDIILQREQEKVIGK